MIDVPERLRDRLTIRHGRQMLADLHRFAAWSQDNDRQQAVDNRFGAAIIIPRSIYHDVTIETGLSLAECQWRERMSRRYRRNGQAGLTVKVRRHDGDSAPFHGVCSALMMKNRWRNALSRAVVVQAVLFFMTAVAVPANGAEKLPGSSIRKVVDAVIPTLMAKDRIPGMAVAVTDGGRAFIFNYGVASTNSRTPVTNDTLFEIGSVTKTFTATLASWAQVQHHLSLADTVAHHLPELQGAPFGNVTLLSLGTHTSGGLPLQFPSGVTNDAQLSRYFEQWRPTYSIGTYRTYTNQGIGMLGLIAGKALGNDFRSLMQQRLFPALGLRHSFIVIPASERARYAWGYTADDKPIRMTAGILADETYGVRTTAADMIRFVRENIDPSDLPSAIRAAITQTHIGYFHAGPMTQDLIWEQYRYPVGLTSLVDGNSPRMVFQPVRVNAIVPPQPPRQDVWLNKTGSTNGFGAYVAFIPSKRLGIVLLANRNYSIADRVVAAYRIVSALRQLHGHR